MRVRKRAMKKRQILFGLLILCGFLFVHPAESRAADKVYTIDVGKTTPAAAEKKLRKMKASSKQEIQLKVNISAEKGYKNEHISTELDGATWNKLHAKAVASNEKLARAKVERWLKQFQNLKTNTYGVLPMGYYPDIYYFRDYASEGTYNIHYNKSYVSDYVNMTAICEKAYAATQGKCEYKGTYIQELMQREQFSYMDIYNNKRIKVDNTNAILGVSEMLQDIPVRQYSKTALKKQSDSVRVQCLLYGVPKAKLFVMDSDTTKTSKESLYDIARGKGRMRSYQNNEYFDASYWACMTWTKLARHLSTEIDVKYWSPYMNPQSASICAKNADGGRDYYQVSSATIRPQNKSSEQYSYMREHLSSLKKDKKTQEYNWITKGKNTEADTEFLKKALQCFADGTYIDFYMSVNRICSDQPIKIKIMNKHTVKYGFTSASYAINSYEDENGQVTWSWTKD